MADAMAEPRLRYVSMGAHMPHADQKPLQGSLLTSTLRAGQELGSTHNLGQGVFMEDDSEAAPPRCMAMDRSLRCEARGGKIYVCDICTGKRTHTLKCKDASILCLCSGEPPEVIFSGDSAGKVRMWDVTTGELVRTFKGHLEMISCVVFCFEDFTLFSASADRTIRKWDPRTGECLATMTGHTMLVTYLAISPQLNCIFSASGDKTVKRWSISDGSLLGTMEGHDLPVTYLEVREEENVLVSVEWRGSGKLHWQLDTGARIKELDGQGGSNVQQTTLLVF
mmetsp:Transcript_89175/g.277225  ORF Transcript_89175/g.277225 Transcript_89175/m.277225 type:complete len:281 (-) Transcript_89175:25-867(-)